MHIAGIGGAEVGAAAGALAGLHAQCFDRPWAGEELAQILTMAGSFTLAAWSGDPDGPAGQFHGFVLARVGEDACDLITVAVAPSARRQGIGRRLVEGALVEAAARGAERMVLEVAVNNDAAHRLYAGCGFRVVGRRPDYYRVSGGGRVAALLMGREVTGTKAEAAITGAETAGPAGRQ